MNEPVQDGSAAPESPIYLVIPLYNDWEALKLLLEKIEAVVDEKIRRRMSFLIIDDCSSVPRTTFRTNGFRSLRIMHLYRNLGHQKAIALGLSYLAHQPETGPTIVMDSDGEDKPEDISRLLEASRQQPGKIIFAHRAKRTESSLFRVFYAVYKTVFRFLTGKTITFGNFSLVPPGMLMKLTHVYEIWNNYPGGVIRSRLPYTAIPIERGTRLAGMSKMNFVSLILHGLSAISVLMDTTAVRIFLFCVITASVSLLAILVSVLLRLVDPWIVPDWISYLVFSLFIVILQAFLISLLLVFIVLIYRTQQHFVPARQYADFVESVEVIY